MNYEVIYLISIHHLLAEASSSRLGAERGGWRWEGDGLHRPSTNELGGVCGLKWGQVVRMKSVT